MHRVRDQDRRMPAGQGLPVRRKGALPMSTEITPFGTGNRLPTKLNKQLARVEQQAIVNAHKVQAINFVGTVALQGVTQLSMTQAECAKLSPEAELRLAAVGDAATAAIQAVVLRLGMEL